MILAEPLQVVGLLPSEESETCTVQLSDPVLTPTVVATVSVPLPLAVILPEVKVAVEDVVELDQPEALAEVTVKLDEGEVNLTQTIVCDEVLFAVKVKFGLVLMVTLVGLTDALQDETAPLTGDAKIRDDINIIEKIKHKK